MADLKIEAIYFEKGGPANTDSALGIAKRYAEEFNIKDIVIASTTGTTAEKALDIFDLNSYNIVIVTHSYYFTGSNKRQEFDEQKMKDLKQKGLNFHAATHSMSGIERGIRKNFNQWCFVDLMAKFLREQFSQGTKVCIEIASMAVDGGFISDLDKDILCIGGTGRGADTVCLIKPAPTSEFDNLRIKAILAKPQ